MQRKHQSLITILGALALLGFLWIYPQSARCQLGNWVHTPPVYEGGVPEDMQLIRTGFTGYGNEPAPDVVWATNMEEGGVFRTVFSSGNWSKDWTGYCVQGEMNFGIDAIRTGTPGNYTEHVMTGFYGLRYKSGSPPAQNLWNPPHTAPDNNWKYKHIHDCAFWCDHNTGTNEFSYPANPNLQYFMLLLDEVTATPDNAKPGIYCWNDYPYFTYRRVDESGWMSTAHSYNRFWRDLKKPSVLYAVRNAQPPDGIPTDFGALVRFAEADYPSANGNVFPVVPIVTGGTLYKVLGFTQWYDPTTPNTVYSYAVVKWLPNGQTTPIHSVWVSSDLTDAGTPTFEEIGELPDEYFPAESQDVWSDMGINSGYEGKIVAKAVSSTVHHLWITCREGLFYSYATVGSSIPITAWVENGLKIRSARAFIPDHPSHFGTNLMKLFLGVHKLNVWYLDQTNGTSNPTYVWSCLKYNNSSGPGYWGVDVRGAMQLVPHAGQDPDILIGGWNIMQYVCCNDPQLHDLKKHRLFWRWSLYFQSSFSNFRK